MSDENKQIEPKPDTELSEAELDKTAGGGTTKYTYIQQKQADGASGNTTDGWNVVDGKVVS
jgi:hypothetical protein